MFKATIVRRLVLRICITLLTFSLGLGAFELIKSQDTETSRRSVGMKYSGSLQAKPKSWIKGWICRTL